MIKPVISKRIRILDISLPSPTAFSLIFFVIVILAILTRLHGLGNRVFSHDESLHAYFSWLFALGKGYQHTPITHGPLQFHLVALFFKLFGDNDYSARLPHALSGIISIVFLLKWQELLGKKGVLATALILLFSPIILYYSRYARNEAFIILFALALWYGTLKYLQSGRQKHLFLFTLALALHAITKETSFIYDFQTLIFLLLGLLIDIFTSPWNSPKFKLPFSFLLVLFLVAIVISTVLFIGNPEKANSLQIGTNISVFLLLFSSILFLLLLLVLMMGFNYRKLIDNRFFSLIIILVTFTLPQTAAIPARLLGLDPLEYHFFWPGFNLPALWMQVPFKTFIIFLFLFLVSFGLGLAWNFKKWLLNAGIFWGIYILFYSSLFTNWAGLATGIVGSLGYWLAQQGVSRGGQPWFYYLFLQIPLYELLPFAGLICSLFFGFQKLIQKKLFLLRNNHRSNIIHSQLTYFFLMTWSISGLVFYSLAGEKMPWLTVHIILPMGLLTGWYINNLFSSGVKRILSKQGILIIFLLSLLIFAIRNSFRASYVHPNEATEFLVYAHGSEGNKHVVSLIEEASQRSSLGFELPIGYDDGPTSSGVSWPLRWYLRNYTMLSPISEISTNQRMFPILILDTNNINKIQSSEITEYYSFSFTRMVWPNQDYFDIKIDTVYDDLRNPELRSGLWNIFFNRDYSNYFALHSFEADKKNGWSPSDKMVLLIENSIANDVWSLQALLVPK